LEFDELIQRAMATRRLYADWEQAQYGRSWTGEEIALGFVGDVGDLAKLIMAHNGIRTIPNSEATLAHELADCLWSIIVLSNVYSIDLERAFLQTMDDIERHLKAQE
jgi:NTP pyrophosphatase (non-canonical NTP hydrolase)